MAGHGLIEKGWTLKFGGSPYNIPKQRKWAGCCDYPHKIIHISDLCLEKYPRWSEIKKVVLHEIAHALFKGILHTHNDTAWKYHCEEIGAFSGAVIHLKGV